MLKLIQERSRQLKAKQIVIPDLPPEPNGIFFFRDELVREVQRRVGLTRIVVDTQPDSAYPIARFRWDASPEDSSAVRDGFASYRPRRFASTGPLGLAPGQRTDLDHRHQRVILNWLSGSALRKLLVEVVNEPFHLRGAQNHEFLAIRAEKNGSKPAELKVERSRMPAELDSSTPQNILAFHRNRCTRNPGNPSKRVDKAR
jgi:hypothetical protein